MCTEFLATFGKVPRRVDLSPVRSWADVSDATAQWAFLALLLLPQRAQYPIVFEDDDVYLSTRSCPVSSLGLPPHVFAAGMDDFVATEVEDAKSFTKQPSLPLVLVQVNAKTLKSKHKLKSYLSQIRRGHTHIAAVEETRR